MAKIIKQVGFVCTGEELILGDTSDTNSVFFSQQLTKKDMHPGQRVIVGDEEEDIEAAIRYLLSAHSAIITIGGLGPTIDDRTRYALSKALNVELTFNEEAWGWIVDRYQKKVAKEIPETNRQQALFPQAGQPIFNVHGTAAACYLNIQNKDIFMLPGPPNECRPIFEDTLLPLLEKKDYVYKIYRRSWYLTHVSESHIAEQLEKMMSDKRCHLGYRVSYPDLEIKLWSDNEEALASMNKKFDAVLGAYRLPRARPSIGHKKK